MSACRNMDVVGRNIGTGAGRLGENVIDDMELLGLQPEWAIFRDVWKDLIWGKRLTLAELGRIGCF